MRNYDADFKRFMLGEGNSPPNISSPQTCIASSPGQASSTPTNVIKRTEKKYLILFKAFKGILEGEWLNVDDSLFEIVSSISNLRQRIYWESKQLKEMSKNTFSIKLRSSFHQGRVHLLKEDIELALSHDLNRHEQMMTGVRNLMSNLNQAQETLGRRLEEIFLHFLNTQKDDIVVNESLNMTVIQLEDLYHQLTAELYRKQELSFRLLESANDDLFAVDDDRLDNFVDESNSPRCVAQSISRSWSRKSEKSCVQEKQLQSFVNIDGRD